MLDGAHEPAPTTEPPTQTKPADNEVTATEPSGDHSVPEAQTDGGPQAPPEPDLDAEDEAPAKKDNDIPERFAPVDEYLDAFARENPEFASTDEFDAWAAEIRESVDYVDRFDTDGTNVVGEPAEEVPGA